MKKQEKRKIPAIPIQKVVVFLIWIGVLAVLFTHRNELTADGIASLVPRNLFLAALVMLGLFVLKSLSQPAFAAGEKAADYQGAPVFAVAFMNSEQKVFSDTVTA